MAKTDAQIGIRVTKEFKERVEAQAQKERLAKQRLEDAVQLVQEPEAETEMMVEDAEPPVFLSM